MQQSDCQLVHIVAHGHDVSDQVLYKTYKPGMLIKVHVQIDINLH